MPDGKPAGTQCINLTEEGLCIIYNQPDYPEVCRLFKPDPVYCGRSKEEALEIYKEQNKDARNVVPTYTIT